MAALFNKGNGLKLHFALYIDAFRIGKKIKAITMAPEQAQRLLYRLNIDESCSIHTNKPTTLDIYYDWLFVKQNLDWTELIEAFLIEPGLGYCVSEVQPVGMLL